MTQAIDYDAVIAELKAEKKHTVEQFDAALAALAALRARRPSTEQQLTLTAVPARSVRPIQGDPYAAMSVAEACEAHLEAVDRSLTTAELTAALVAGGFQSKSQEFRNIVYNTLHVKTKVFRRDGDVWSLKKWPEAKIA